MDLSPLNKHCLRETYSTEILFFQVSRVKPGTWKSVMDAWNGYHAVEMEEELRNLTAFITPFGRYRYRRALQGQSGSGDAYTKRADEITKDVEWQRKVVNDALLYDNSIEGIFYHTFDFLKLCGDNGIKFNKEKFQFCQRTLLGRNLRDALPGITEFYQIKKEFVM